MKKKILIALSIFLLTSVFAQESLKKPESFKEFIQTSDFVLKFEPAVYVNTESTLVSAPSPIIYPISIGFIWPNYTLISVQPTLSFFMMNHLYYNGRAVPAEIENRTTTTLSFLLNIPAVYSFFKENSRFEAYGGLGILMRFGILSHGVNESDSGYLGTASQDVSAINKYFWNDLHWLYFTSGGSWLYNLTSELRAGPTLSIALPIGSLISDHDVQGMIISLGIKICR